MKVYLAAQTFSTSVADALEFPKNYSIPQFKDSEATINFIRKIDALFDILNSKSRYSKGNKAVLRCNTEQNWRPVMTSIIDYILRCTDIKNRPLWLTPRKTAVIGFCISPVSICGIYESPSFKTRQIHFSKKMSYIC
ncbi:uncharacterized protein LOC115887004 [Sitophilus oryzae]|uniref:Uncharacterized protein LOC115887004 n=1 Tax=Sitophilus oryzae TaxID=7048 RepID=A0A6J2YGE8_SITOR|nr:uncharacterized protein LOC115887004 [Sitophilus oryzae]